MVVFRQRFSTFTRDLSGGFGSNCCCGRRSIFERPVDIVNRPINCIEDWVEREQEHERRECADEMFVGNLDAGDLPVDCVSRPAGSEQCAACQPAERLTRAPSSRDLSFHDPLEARNLQCSEIVAGDI